MSVEKVEEVLSDFRNDRIEVKYFFPLERVDQLIGYISPFMNVDSFASREGKGNYEVGSIYFDGEDRDYYWSHVEGYPHRRKVRIRCYGENDAKVYYWEIKEKMFVSSKKFRWPVSKALIQKIQRCAGFNDLYDLVCEVPMSQDGQLSQCVGYDILQYKLSPVLFVSFTRMPFMAKKEKYVRLTIDYNIKASRACYPVCLGHLSKPQNVNKLGVGVLELKFDGRIPGWLEDVLVAFDLRRIAFSKYKVAADMLYKTGV